MPDIPEERTYKNSFSKTQFEEIIQTKWRNKKNRQEFNVNGIYVGKLIEFAKKFPELENLHLNSDEDIVFVNNTYGQNDELIPIENRGYPLPNIIFYKCKIETLLIKPRSTKLNSSSDYQPKQLITLRCEISDIDTQDSNINGDFEFLNSSINSLKILNSDIGNTEFSSCAISSISLNNTASKDFAIKNSIVNSINIKNDCSIKDITITNQTVIKDSFSIIKSKAADISISRGCITGSIFLEHFMGRSIKVTNCFPKAVLIKVCQLDNCEINKVFTDIKLRKSQIGQFELNSSKIDSFSINNECDVELYISNCLINLIDFKSTTLSKKTTLSFSQSNLYACNMDGLSVLGNLYFKDVKNTDHPFTYLEVKNNYINDYKNTNEQINLLKNNYHGKRDRWQKRLNIRKPTFRIVQSSLGKTEFTDCKLKAFKFEYSNSKIDEVFISGGTVPIKDIGIYKIEDKKSKPYHQQKVAIYTQLKKIFGRLGDVYHESKFHAQASYHQLKLLKHLRRDEVGNETSKLKKVWKWIAGEETFEILTYRLNQLSNKHRASWGRSVGFVLISSSLLFTFYLTAGGILSLNPWNAYWEVDGKLAGQLFTFLNPTHRISFMTDAKLPIELGFWTNLWDFVGRIVIGYGIYQFISAFRKHGKRA